MAKEEKKFKEIKSGQIVRVHWKLKEDKKERIQVFEGLIIARKHGFEPGATITVRAEKAGFGIERIFPIHSPLIDKIEIIKQTKVRRAKLYYLRHKRK
ncbi:MAG: 50S ribosomal protein L19 [bacterium]